MDHFGKRKRTIEGCEHFILPSQAILKTTRTVAHEQDRRRKFSVISESGDMCTLERVGARGGKPTSQNARELCREGGAVTPAPLSSGGLRRRQLPETHQAPSHLIAFAPQPLTGNVCPGTPMERSLYCTLTAVVRPLLVLPLPPQYGFAPPLPFISSSFFFFLLFFFSPSFSPFLLLRAD